MPYDDITKPVRPQRARTPRPQPEPAQVTPPTTTPPPASTTTPPAQVTPLAAAPPAPTMPDATRLDMTQAVPPTPVSGSHQHTTTYQRSEPARAPQREPVTITEMSKYILPIAATSIALAFCCLVGGIVNLVLELAFVRPKIAEYKAAGQPVPGQLTATRILNWIGISLAALSGLWLMIYCGAQAFSSS